MKVLFAGDIHGNTAHLEWLLHHAQTHDVDRIIAVGDFGYWPNTGTGQAFLGFATGEAAAYGIPIWWLDGNHENHAAIHTLTAIHGTNQPIPTDDEWVGYLPRGCTVDLDGIRLLAYGGAWSMDWMDRTEGVTWWPEEAIDFDHLERVADTTGVVDVLATHECPAGNPVGYCGEHPVALTQRLYIGHLVDKAKPRLVISGHHHVRAEWNDPVTGAPVYVLGRDGQGDESIYLLDTDTLKQSVVNLP